MSRLELSESNILADKAYGTNQILDYIQRADGEYTIPPKSNAVRPWRCDWHIYKDRHVIECFFQKLKWFRRVSTRYDKRDDVFLACVFLASILILLKRYYHEVFFKRDLWNLPQLTKLFSMAKPFQQKIYM